MGTFLIRRIGNRVRCSAVETRTRRRNRRAAAPAPNRNLKTQSFF